MNEIIRVNCLKHVYPDRTEVSVCNTSLVVNTSERLCILGPNGSGKTTLLHHIVGLLRPVEGAVRVFGMDPVSRFSEVRKRVGVVFQDVDEQLIGPTVWDDVAFGLRSRAMSQEQLSVRTNEILKDTGIDHIARRLVHYLSGGEKRKVAIAGAMVTNPELLVLDEPFDGLDPASRNEIVDLLLRWNRRKNTTMILTTHDMDVVPKVATRACVIKGGNVLKMGDPLNVLSDIDMLHQANLEPPSMMELFSLLSSAGYGVTPPVSAYDAMAQIARLVAMTPTMVPMKRSGGH